MNDRDRKLANIAQLIISAYNGSYKPHLMPKEKEVAPPYYMWKHSREVYSLITSQAEDFVPPIVLVTDESISDFVEHVFLILTGKTDVKWKNVYTSDAVKHALSKHFGMEVELSNAGCDHKFDMFGMSELPIKPTIWAKRVIDDTTFKEMEEKSFDYWDRNRWYIEL